MAEMSQELRDLIDAEAEHAEAMEADQTDRPLPPGTKVSRPNRARSKMLHVRLNPEELAALEEIAAKRELPVSTLARDWLLRMAKQDAPPPPPPSPEAVNAYHQALDAYRRAVGARLRDLPRAPFDLPRSMIEDDAALAIAGLSDSDIDNALRLIAVVAFRGRAIAQAQDDDEYWPSS